MDSRPATIYVCPQPAGTKRISATLLALKGLNNNTTTGYTYLYDQLNRLLNTRQHVFGAASGSFMGNWTQSNTNTTDNYAETFRYDANGNMLQLNRNGNSQHPGGQAMDRLNYTYRDGTNQLWSVQDGIAAGAYAGDIDNQGGSNYSYDRIGNLIGDVSENISQVNWTVYGKIGNIQKKQAFLGYVYNAGGERVVKQYLPYATNQCAECPPGTGIDDLEVYERNSATPETYKARKTITFLSEYTDVRYRDYSAIIEAGLAQCTPQCAARPALNTSDADIYIRDATGNTLAVYHYDRKTAQLRWSEQHLYGSSRLGMYQPEKVVTLVSTDSKQREVGYLGKQVFELSNHLGNILATITDKKLQVSTNTTSTDYFEAEVQTVQDYYAFGMQMPGRKLSGGYRYGFNGKENDNEVKGEGNSQDYGMRIYDGRIGKFLSVDPITSKYPYLTPYQFASNRPIDGIDLDGLEFFKKDYNQYTIDYRPVLKAPNVVTGIDNAAHNVIGVVWNGTAGAVAEMAKSVNNYFAGGYKEKDYSPDPVYAFMEGTNEMFRYSTRTPLKQQAVDFGNAALDPRNYEFIPSFVIAHKFPVSNGMKPAAKFATTEGMTSSILATENRTTTILGRLTDTRPLAEELSNIKSGMNNGGFNILKIPDEYYSWPANEKWLQRAINRNDIIKAASNPMDLRNIWKNGMINTERTIFGKEVELLEKNGYKYSPSTKEFSRTIKK